MVTVNQVALCDLTERGPESKIPQWVYESLKEDFSIFYTVATRSRIIIRGGKGRQQRRDAIEFHIYELLENA